ncbi:MAG: hypothetical protein ACFFCZ_30445 [Promethearchaeota archaeon]
MSMGIVKESIFFHVQWQASFPDNVSQEDPLDEYYWRLDRKMEIDWTLQNDRYMLEIKVTPPRPKDQRNLVYTRFDSLLREATYRTVYEEANRTDSIV